MGAADDAIRASKGPGRWPNALSRTDANDLREARAEIVRLRVENERLRAAIDPATLEIAGLRSALSVALRQWEMYAEMVEQPVDLTWRLATEKTAEGDMYRAGRALLDAGLPTADGRALMELFDLSPDELFDVLAGADYPDRSGSD